MSAVLSGQLASWPSKQDLAAILEAADVRVIVGAYSLCVANASHFVFQHLGGDFGEPQIDADAASVAEMLSDAARVSEALSKARIRHRFEIYDEDNALAAYLHWEWPPGEPTAKR